MDSLIHADVFFFITSISIFIVTVIIVIAAFYIIKILRDLKHISERAKTEGDELLDDMKKLRENVKIQGAGLKNISKFFSSLFNKRK